MKNLTGKIDVFTRKAKYENTLIAILIFESSHKTVKE